MSATEKNFDDLLNDKCSWSYKTLTINLETNKEHHSLFQSPNEDANKHSTENEDDSLVIDSSFDTNDSRNIDQNVNEPQLSIQNECKEKTEMLPKDCNDAQSPYKTVFSTNDNCSLSKDETMNDADTIDASLNTDLKQSELHTNAVMDYSSSDDEVVLQTRICNEEGKQFSNVPEETSNHSGEHLTDPSKNQENSNSFFNENSNEHVENGVPETISCSSKREESLIAAPSNQTLEFNILSQKRTPCFRGSFTEKKYRKYKSTLDTSSFELSSLSESEEADDKIIVDTIVTPGNKMKDSNKSTIELHAEIVKKCIDISSECHSICDDLEMNENSLKREIEHDFFNGNFDINKYEINKKNSKNTTILTEKHEKKQNINLNHIKYSNKDRYKHSQEITILDIDSDDESNLENINKTEDGKTSKRKSSIKQKQNTVNNKNSNDIVHITKTPAKRNHTSNIISTENSNSHKQVEGKITNKITEDTLLDNRSQDSTFCVRKKLSNPIASCDFLNGTFTNEHEIEKDCSLKNRKIDFKLIYSKEKNKFNPTSLKDVEEAVTDTFVSTTPKMKQTEFQTDSDEISEYYNFENGKNRKEQKKLNYVEDVKKEVTNKLSHKIISKKKQSQRKTYDDISGSFNMENDGNSKGHKHRMRTSFMGAKKVTNRSKSLPHNNLNKITKEMKPKHQTDYDEVTESCYLETDEMEDLTCDVSFQFTELMEEKTHKDLSFEKDSGKKAFNYSIAELYNQAGSLSSENENYCLSNYKFDSIQPENVTKNKRHKNNLQFEASKVEQISLINMEDKNKRLNLEASIVSNKGMSIAAKKIKKKKNTKTWDNELHNLLSHEISSDPEKEILVKKTSHENNSISYSRRKKMEEPSTAGQGKAQMLDTDSVNSVSLNKKYDSLEYKQIKKISSILPQKEQGDLSLVSPNANIINKAMKSMEMCTLPYLTSCQERDTWMNDFEINEDSSESPILTEYNYSFKEIQSTIHFSTTNSLNSAKKYRNFIKTGERKARICKIEQKSMLKKNYKQENITSITKSKDNRSSKFPVAIKLNETLSTPKDSRTIEYKVHAVKETSKDNTKDSILGTILGRLQVKLNSCNAQRAGSNDGDLNEINKLVKTKTLKTKRATANLEISVSPEETDNLNCTTEMSRRQADAHYNLRKRKCKSPEEFQIDDFQNNQSQSKKGRKVNTGDINRNGVKIERSSILSSEENSFESKDTDRNSGSDYRPRQRKENRRQKSIKMKNSKLNETIGYSHKKKVPESEKKKVCPIKRKFHGSLNNNTSLVESRDVFFGMDENKQKAIENESKLRDNDSHNLVKNLPIGMKSITRNLHSDVNKNYISQPNFSKEQKKSPSKNSNKGNYIKYLEQMFKNKKGSSQRIDSNQNVPFTIHEQTSMRKELIADRDEDQELFSLSSSDSDDNEGSQKNRCSLGLFDSVITDCEEE